MGASDTWTEPGVALRSWVTGADDEELATAVPAWIGWRSDSTPVAQPWRVIRSWDAAMTREDAAGLFTTADGELTLLGYTLRHYFDNGGGPCFLLEVIAPTFTPVPDSAAGGQAFESWWNAQLEGGLAPLLSEPTITLAAIPQLTNVVSTLYSKMDSSQKRSEWKNAQAKTLSGAWKALLTACLTASTRRPDVFFVLDAPSEPDVAKACIDALRGEQSLGEIGQHAALYGPHLVTNYRKAGASGQEPTKPDTLYHVVPPCGAVMGMYARTDDASGVWKAPANETLSHVVMPQYRETQTLGWFDMSQATINLIRSFPGRGTRVWGCRTLAGTAGSPFRYVQVRRLVTWIEANLRQICRFAVFEPNHEITWFQLRALCSAWLRRVWLEGGLAGADEASAFAVRVGLSESMTQADIDAGQLIVKIGVAALHTAEFVEVKLTLKLGDAQSIGHETNGSASA